MRVFLQLQAALFASFCWDRRGLSGIVGDLRVFRVKRVLRVMRVLRVKRVKRVKRVFFRSYRVQEPTCRPILKTLMMALKFRESESESPPRHVLFAVEL